MRSISVKLRFKVNKHRATGGEFIVGNSLLEFCVALVDFGVKCGGIKFLPGHCKLVDECEMKTAETFDRSVAAAFRESRRAATHKEKCSGAEESISTNDR